MKPAPLAYARATDIGHALALWREAGPDARLIAGGQSLIAGLNLRLSDVPVVIDITRIESLRGIEEAGTVLRIGALTTHDDIARSALVAQHAPAMAQAAPLIAHAAIRTRGTIGGSLAYADPAAEWPAVVLALEGTIIAASSKGERRIRAEDFFLGLFETALQPFEMIVAVEIPKAAPGERHVVKELARRSGDYAMVGLVARFAGARSRLAFFGVGDTPVLAKGAMTALGSGVEAASAALDGDLDPPDDLQASGAMKRHLAKVLLKRALAEAAG
ncbi:MAG: FAD binding domain-containing protein [Proteobacteria bacterium]|nr:FAD binding domain-containing protein [Pseudomonadota bacterium]